MSDIKLLGLDLDGTLLDIEKKVSEVNADAVRRAISAGVKVFPITGRPFSAIVPGVLEAADFDYAVSSCGAVVRDLKTGKRIRETLIPKSRAEEIVKLMVDAGFVVGVYIEDTGYNSKEALEASIANASTPAMREYYQKYRTGVPDILEFLKDSGKDVEKLTLGSFKNTIPDEKECAEILRLLKPYEADLDIMYGKSMLCEITDAKATKGHTMLEFGKMLGIERSQIMAIGDTNNDRDMIEAVGVGVAMENAEPSLKEVADFVTRDNNHNGVAYAIDKLIFHK